VLLLRLLLCQLGLQLAEQGRLGGHHLLAGCQC
jgi:hypothetical protein